MVWTKPNLDDAGLLRSADDCPCLKQSVDDLRITCRSDGAVQGGVVVVR
jgi:hypothetical protein